LAGVCRTNIKPGSFSTFQCLLICSAQIGNFNFTQIQFFGCLLFHGQFIFDVRLSDNAGIFAAYGRALTGTGKLAGSGTGEGNDSQHAAFNCSLTGFAQIGNLDLAQAEPFLGSLFHKGLRF
jgi:hypothetical protein